MFVAGEPASTTEHRQKDEKRRGRQRRREQREREREGGMRRIKKNDNKGAERREGRGRGAAVLQACRWFGSPGVGRRLCSVDTHSRDRWRVQDSLPDSLSTREPLTRNGTVTSRPRVPQVSGEERGRQRHNS